MNKTHALLLLQIASFWPVWQWYARRLSLSSAADDHWGILAVVTAVFLLIGYPAGSGQADAAANLQSGGVGIESFPAIPSLLMLLYAVSFYFLPPILRAAIAFTALGVTVSIVLGRRFTPPLWGLLLLALPVIPSLQFYLGYPLRVVVGALTVPLLQLSGLDVMRDGTSLNWGGQMIEIDAPCSGVRMLWAGFYLLFTLAGLFRLNIMKTAVAALTAVPVIVAGNVLRASSLFYLEAKILIPPDILSAATMHTAIGVVAFAVTTAGIISLLRCIAAFRVTGISPV